MTYYEADMYPVQLDVEYPEGSRNRITTLFRLILMIPVVVVAALASMGAGLLFVATLLMILFRNKYPDGGSISVSNSAGSRRA